MRIHKEVLYDGVLFDITVSESDVMSIMLGGDLPVPKQLNVFISHKETGISDSYNYPSLASDKTIADIIESAIVQFKSNLNKNGWGEFGTKKEPIELYGGEVI